MDDNPNDVCFCPYFLSCFCGEMLYVVGVEAGSDGTVAFTMCPGCKSKWKLSIRFEEWLSEE